MGFEGVPCSPNSPINTYHEGIHRYSWTQVTDSRAALCWRVLICNRDIFMGTRTMTLWNWFDIPVSHIFEIKPHQAFNFGTRSCYQNKQLCLQSALYYNVSSINWTNYFGSHHKFCHKSKLHYKPSASKYKPLCDAFLWSINRIVIQKHIWPWHEIKGKKK